LIVQVWIAAVIGIAAVIEDVACRRISNWIPLSAFAAGLLWQCVRFGWRGAMSALLGTVTGFSVFLIFYLLGGMGGGDVKLMAGFGAVLGVKKLLEAALWTAACGGMLAAVVIAASAIRGFWKSYRAPAATTEGASRGVQSAQSIPYAPAIAAGVWLSLVPKG
jgi:prepilin peptidase CpaA